MVTDGTAPSSTPPARPGAGRGTPCPPSPLTHAPTLLQIPVRQRLCGRFPMNTATNTRAQEFRERLSLRVMVADGAMGTMLYSRGVFINRCFDELNLSSPDLVRQIHQDYVKAGAEILETNTFGANRMRLASFGLSEKQRAINQAGVKLAREAARDTAFVAGAVGPLGTNIEPFGPTSFAEARAIFREQAEMLVEADVDLLVLETFYNLDELREAIFAARE